MLVAGLSGTRARVAAGWREVRRLARRSGGVPAPLLGEKWRHSRFRTPGLRDALWAEGWGVDTVETATTWSALPALVTRLEAALTGALAPWATGGAAGGAAGGARVHAFTHLSHPYPTGSNAYTTFVFRLGRDGEETLARWRALKAAATSALLAAGGTLSHQHGVGEEHRPHLAAEKGPLGVAAVRAALTPFDPGGLMNPGKLV
jgi:alkyldihydroxyacetonephosphate synthase